MPEATKWKGRHDVADTMLDPEPEGGSGIGASLSKDSGGHEEQRLTMGALETKVAICLINRHVAERASRVEMTAHTEPF